MINNIHLVMLNRLYKPKHLYDLIRIGKNNDGGYLIEKQSLESARSLISFGLSTDWSFEKHFYKLNPVLIHSYDHTLTLGFLLKNIFKNFMKILIGKIMLPIRSIGIAIDYLIFFRDNKLHFLEKIGSEQKATSLNKVFSKIDENKKPFFIKIDIEGSEYRIMDDLIDNADDISGLAIELHDVDLHKEKIENFIKNFSLKLVHIHPNNFSDLDKNGDPTTLEITFANSPKIINSKSKIPHELDQKNNPDGDDQILNFVEY